MLKRILIYLTVSAPFTAHSNDYGGDLVVCVEPDSVDTKNKVPAGVYTLDFIQASHPADWYYNPSSLDDSLDRVSFILEQIDRGLWESFKEYRSLISNTNPFTKKRSWKIDDAKLNNLPDESFIRRLPSNCEPLAEGNQESEPRGVFQVIVRKEVSDKHIIYEANGPMLEKVSEVPLQISMLHVHEWLRDYLSITYNLYHATAELHSLAAVERVRSGVLKEVLQNLGCLKVAPIELATMQTNEATETHQPQLANEIIKLVPTDHDEFVEFSEFSEFVKIGPNTDFSTDHIAYTVSNPNPNETYLRIWVNENYTVDLVGRITSGGYALTTKGDMRLFTFSNSSFTSGYTSEVGISVRDGRGCIFEAELNLILRQQYELRFPEDFKLKYTPPIK